MQPASSSPLSRPVLNPFSFNDGYSSDGFDGPRVLLFASLMLFQGGEMNLSKVAEKILSWVRSASSLGILSPLSDRPEVLINGLQHFVPGRVKLKLQTVETFIEAYYLPETEYVHWARAHPLRKFCALMELVANLPRCYTIKSDKRNI